MNRSTGTDVPGGGHLVELEGDWDLARKDELKSLFDFVPASEPLTIDLRRVTYGDSSFLSVLAMLAQRFKETPITLLGASTGLKHILTMMEFDRIFRIVDA